MIPLSRAEKDAIAEHTGRRVKTVPGVLVQIHNKHFLLRPGDEETMNCVYLKKERCSIYSVRPLVCRLYGVSNGMQCPHGCQPSRLLTDVEAHLLIEETANLK
jgi:Fe-S-cluster containining protein